MSELKPCPFCGGKAFFEGSFTHPGYGYVNCDFCGVVTPWGVEGEAIDAWNRRTERTCRIEKWDGADLFALSCGHAHQGIMPNYCPSCGARVIETDGGE